MTEQVGAGSGAVMPGEIVNMSLEPMNDTQEQQQTGRMEKREVRPVKTQEVTYSQLCFAFTVVVVVGFCLFAMTMNMGDGPKNDWLRNLLGFDNGTNSN